MQDAGAQNNGKGTVFLQGAEEVSLRGPAGKEGCRTGSQCRMRSLLQPKKKKGVRQGSPGGCAGEGRGETKSQGWVLERQGCMVATVVLMPRTPVCSARCNNVSRASSTPSPETRPSCSSRMKGYPRPIWALLRAKKIPVKCCCLERSSL